MAAWILSPRAGRRIRPLHLAETARGEATPGSWSVFAPAAAPVPNRQKRIDGAVTATGLMRPTLGLTRAASGKRGPRALGEQVAIVAAIGAREDDEARVAMQFHPWQARRRGIDGCDQRQATGRRAGVWSISGTKLPVTRPPAPPAPQRSPDPAPRNGRVCVCVRRCEAPVRHASGHPRRPPAGRSSH